jgi:hypothetical protein
MADVSSTKHSLDEAGAKRAQSKQLREEAAEILEREIPNAIAAGIPIAEIARRANMTRKAVYDLTSKL